MAAPYVTAAEILAAVGIGSPTAGDTAWATKCAAAIEAIITERLDGATPSTELDARLQVAAELDGARMFTTRSAPNGILAFGPDGDAVRMGSSQTFALDSVFLPGIG
jgi:hypothetical protein